MHEISLAAEHIFSIGSFGVTNTLLVTLLISILLIVFALLLKRNMNTNKMSGMQNLVELIVEGAFSLMDGVTGDRKQTKRFFPLVMTLFLFILCANWSGLLPGVGPIGIRHEEAHAEEATEIVSGKAFEETAQSEVADDHTDETVGTEDASHTEEASVTETHEEEKHESLTPLFRAPSSDLNTTLALAIISLISFQVFGIAAVGFFTYFKKFLNFKGPIDFFLGILEIVSEIAKMISLSFRLFGNVFAGEVLLVVIAFLVPIIAPLPFFALEIFVGLIQAFIFAMLTLVFLKVATMAEH